MVSEITFALVVIAFMLILIGLAFWAGRRYEHNSGPAREARNFMAHTQRTNRRLCTSSQTGTIDLRSWDGGVNWYAVDSKSNGDVVVLGEAEVVHPGALKELLRIYRGA